MSPHLDYGNEYVNIGYGMRAATLNTFILEDCVVSGCIGDQLNRVFAAECTADYVTREAGSWHLNH